MATKKKKCYLKYTVQIHNSPQDFRFSSASFVKYPYPLSKPFKLGTSNLCRIQPLNILRSPSGCLNCGEETPSHLNLLKNPVNTTGQGIWRTFSASSCKIRQKKQNYLQNLSFIPKMSIFFKQTKIYIYIYSI